MQIDEHLSPFGLSCEAIEHALDDLVIWRKAFKTSVLAQGSPVVADDPLKHQLQILWEKHLQGRAPTYLAHAPPPRR